VPPEEWGDGAYIEDPGGTQPRISFLKVPESTVAKNRVHFDVQAGATVVREDVQDGVPDHVVMADPEGNEFCVL
jgi:predicted enzyme related to lactoylglutathione lyase